MSEARDPLNVEVDESRDLLEKIEKFLNEDVACLPCASRVRTMDEDTWSEAMYLRDLVSLHRAKFEEFR